MKDVSPGLELAWKLTFPHEAKCPTAGLRILLGLEPWATLTRNRFTGEPEG